LSSKSVSYLRKLYSLVPCVTLQITSRDQGDLTIREPARANIQKREKSVFIVGAKDLGLNLTK